MPKRNQVDFTPEPNQLAVMPKPNQAFLFLGPNQSATVRLRSGLCNCVAVMLQKSRHFWEALTFSQSVFNPGRRMIGYILSFEPKFQHVKKTITTCVMYVFFTYA